MKERKKKKGNYLSLRINIMFFVIFLLFSVLIFRLGMVQIVFGEDYKREIERTVEVPVTTPVPRGKIYDANGKLIVGNNPQKAITYTRSHAVTQKEMIETAKLLAKLIKKDSEEDLKAITQRDRQDFWIIENPELALKKIKEEDKDRLTAQELSKAEYDKQIYDMTRERITEEELNSFSKEELEVLAIFREMSSSIALTPHPIKNKNVEEKEFAIVSENLHVLPGVDTTVDWDRFNAFKDEDGNVTLGSVLGKITTSKEGLPSDMLEYYEARGYSRNDRVGKSYLEMQYEDVLQGQKQIIKNHTDKTGNLIKTEIVRDGKAGKDLVLTTDIEFQQEVEKIIQKRLGNMRASQYYMDRAFVSVMNPKTGEILAMAGKQYVKDKETNKTEINDYALGNMNTSYSMGSTVKGATVLAGYQTGVIQQNTYLYDSPLHFKGTQVKRSWNTSGFGSINELYALRRSSNVYMFLIAMKIGGQPQYVAKAPLSINKIEGINELRRNFNQFGLGVKTGIDLPGEHAGYGGDQIPPEPGKVLDFAIGQYDTYTPLQLVQYISTIANGGYRIQPHIVKEIREPNYENDELGPVYQEIKPTVLNKVDMKDQWINNVKEGFRQVVNHNQGTAYSSIKNKQYKIAGKTGTAQALYDGPLGGHPMLWNLTFAGYAPYDDPEIALSVVVPWASTDKTHINLDIADEVFKAYFDLKEKRAKGDAAKENEEISGDGTE
ncbi:peptidoglycan D,D-transpeptidase FtsI family protein [Cytobacillus purgationiresistens]|uniref:serine-type D-Ala-D-Ala carboxypeptidase n=1 Tax=Cytobacillus purgationiresistens TaxID=863449 RepID=A0ABU0AAG6_9BACI|nr:penicillin-binding protein 2 [Cytobacillus purgationiresistens]MDQ0268244.1 cell division protein FtsI/penicillin-binding protein 2 [Cytobacillus purgationiresistens]